MNLYILVALICIRVSYELETSSWKMPPEEEIKKFAKALKSNAKGWLPYG